MRLIYYITFTLIIGLFTSCNSQSEVSSTLLLEASRFADSNPDSAMRLIDSIIVPERSLSKEQYMQYLVKRVQIRYKNYYDIAKDTLVFQAADYFTKQNKDNEQIALAQFYGGCVLREQKKYEEAMTYYKRANMYANMSKDDNIQGLVQYNIGDLLSEQGLHGIALERYRDAATYYWKYPEKQAHSYSAMGRMFLLEGVSDSAFYYLHQAFDIAKNTNSDKLQSQFAQSLGVAYKEIKKYSEAEKYLRESQQLTKDLTNLPRHYLNLADLYYETYQLDSTKVYVNKLKESLGELTDSYFQISALSFLAQWERAQGNIDAAFDYQNHYMQQLSQVMEERSNQSVYEIEQKYNYEHIQKRYYHTLTVRQQWIIALLAIVIFGGVSFSWYWIKQNKRQIEVQQNMDTLVEMNRDLESMVYKKQLNLRQDLLWRFDVTKKVMKLNEDIEKKGNDSKDRTLVMARFNNIVYGKTTLDEQWDALLQTFHNARPGYAEKIRENYPDLTESEFRISILTYADFSVKEIAVVLQQSPNTVQTRRTTLRQKMGVVKGGDIADHLDFLFNNT